MAHSAHISCILFHLYRTLSNRRRQRAARDNREMKQKAEREKEAQICEKHHKIADDFTPGMPCQVPTQFYENQTSVCVNRKDVRQNTHNSQRVQQQLLSASWIAQALLFLFAPSYS